MTRTLRAGHQRDPPGWASLTHSQFLPSVRDAKGRVTWNARWAEGSKPFALALAFSVAERKKCRSFRGWQVSAAWIGVFIRAPLYPAMMLPASPFLDLTVLTKITQAVQELNSGVLLHCELIMRLRPCKTLDWLSLGVEPKAPSTGCRH